MEDWLSLVEAHTGPRYLAIADAIDDAVRRGQLGVGDRLPAQRKLARRLGITVGTVTRAYAEAERRGLVAGEVGRGTFVADRGAGIAPTESVLWPEGEETAAEGPIDLASDSPVVGFRDGELANSLHAFADSAAFTSLLADGRDSSGPGVAEALAAWHADLTEASAARILPTNGSGGVLAALLTALVPDRGPVLVEALTGRAVRAALAHCGLRASPVQIDDEGIIPESLELAAWSSGARVLVCTPSLHDPSSAILPEARRKAVAEIAERFEVTIIELEGQARLLDRVPAPVASHAPERTVYVASLADSLAPWLAAGYAAVPEGLADRMKSALIQAGVPAPPLSGGLAAHWIEDRLAHSLLSLQRTEARWRGRLARSILGDRSLSVRLGGLRAWIRPLRPWTGGADGIAARAGDAGVRLAPAHDFETRRGSPPGAVRLSFGACGGPERLRRALEILLPVLEDR